MARTPRSPARLSRRDLLGSWAAITAASASQASATGKVAAEGWTPVRRVVTSYDAAGKSVVMSDGPASNALVLNGTRISRLWEAHGLPVQLPLGADLGATAGNAYRPGFVGTSFYVAELPGGKRAPNIPLHDNATLDYMAILSGKIAFVLDGGREIVLGAGDTLVQGGNMHTWINRWRQPCMLLFVVVSGIRHQPMP
jgi:hypothetical protein